MVLAASKAKYLSRCRLCGRISRKPKDILAEHERDKLLGLIILCVSIEIKENDELPKKLCIDCERKLLDWQAFCIKCKKTQDTLWKVIAGPPHDKLHSGQSPSQAKGGRKNHNGESKKQRIRKKSVISNNCITICNEGDYPKVLNQEGHGKLEHSYNRDKKGFGCDNNAVISLHEVGEVLNENPVSSRENSVFVPKVSSVHNDLKNVMPCGIDKNEEIKQMLVHNVNNIEHGSDSIHQNIPKDPSEFSASENFGSSKFNVTDLCSTSLPCKGEVQDLHVTITQDASIIIQRHFDNWAKKESNVALCEVPGFKDQDIEETQIPKVEEYMCGDCKEIFVKKSKYEKHLKTHSSGYQCDKCPKKLKTQVSLKYHLSTHSEYRNFCCHTCGKLFKTYTCLLNHFKIHMEEKKYKCHICGKEFRQSNHLVEHKKTHTGEKPFNCGDCDHRFVTKAQLIRHVQTVHKKLKKYKCDMCGKEFFYNYNYQAHMMRHMGLKNMQCELCDKSFFTKNAKFRHMRFHTREKPFKCDICGKAFADCSNCKKHRMKHDSPKTKGSGRRKALPQPAETKATGEEAKTGAYSSLKSFLESGVETFATTREEETNVEYVTMVPAENKTVVAADTFSLPSDACMFLTDGRELENFTGSVHNDETIMLLPSAVNLDLNGTLEVLKPLVVTNSYAPFAKSGVPEENTDISTDGKGESLTLHGPSASETILCLNVC